MNRVGFLAKIAMVASIFAALAFTFSCSEDICSDGTSSSSSVTPSSSSSSMDDNDGGAGKWCVIGGTEPRCVEIGAKFGGGQTMTEEICKMQYDYSIEDEKPSGCKDIGE